MQSSRASSTSDNESVGENDISCEEASEEITATATYTHYSGSGGGGGGGAKSGSSIRYIVPPNAAATATTYQYQQSKAGATNLLPSVTACGPQIYMENNYMYKAYSYIPPPAPLYAHPQPPPPAAIYKQTAALPMHHHHHHHHVQYSTAKQISPEVVSIRYFAPVQQANTLLAKGGEQAAARQYAPQPLPSASYSDKKFYFIDSSPSPVSPYGIKQHFNYNPAFYPSTPQPSIENITRLSHFDLAAQFPQQGYSGPDSAAATLQRSATQLDGKLEQQKTHSFIMPISNTWNMAGGAAGQKFYPSSSLRANSNRTNFSQYYNQNQNLIQKEGGGGGGKNFLELMDEPAKEKKRKVKIACISALVSVLVAIAIAGAVTGVLLPMKFKEASARKSNVSMVAFSLNDSSAANNFTEISRIGNSTAAMITAMNATVKVETKPSVAQRIVEVTTSASSTKTASTSSTTSAIKVATVAINATTAAMNVSARIIKPKLDELMFNATVDHAHATTTLNVWLEKKNVSDTVADIEIIDNPDKINKTEKTENPEKTKNIEKINKVEKIEKPEKAEKIDKADKVTIAQTTTLAADILTTKQITTTPMLPTKLLFSSASTTVSTSTMTSSTTTTPLTNKSSANEKPTL